MFNEMISENHNFSVGNLHTMITDILYHIKDNRKAIKGVFLSESGDLFATYFRSYFNKLIETHLFLNYDESIFRVPKDFLINHISGSFVEMVRWWIEKNMKQTPEELTTYFIAVIAPAIAQLQSNK